jgi:vitamin B12 transporter
MKSHLEITAAALFSCAWVGCASAQDASPTALVNVSPGVITATLIPTPEVQVGSSISLIRAKDIEQNQWRTVPDALADAPGLNVVQTGGAGGETSVFIRGANSNHTKVLIDGIEVNDPSKNDAFDFGQLLTADLDRVEVLRGPQSSLYGSDALGGVINVITRRGEGPARITASVEGGSFDTLNETAGLAGSAARFNYAVNVEHFHSGDTPVTPLGLLAPGEHAIGNYYDNITLSTRLGADLTDAFGLDLVVRYTGSELRSTSDDFDVFPSVPDSVQTVQHDRQFFTRGQARLSLFDGKFQNVLGVGYTDYRTKIQAPDDGFGLPAPTYDNGDRLKFDWQGNLALGHGQILVLGLDDDTERLINSPINARDADRAAFAELQSKVAHNLNLAVSVRYDDDDRFGGKTTWRIAPTWLIAATGTQLKASYGTGFKAPTLTQLFVSFPEFNFFANPDLKPETSQGFDVGFEQPLAAGHVRLGATYFHNRIRDLIDTNAAGDSYANIDRATTYGVESFIAVTPVTNVTLRADYTWTIAKDDVTDEELLLRPKNKASVAANWRATDRLTLSASLLYVSSFVDGNRDFSIPRLEASPYSVANIAAAYDLGHGVTLFGRVDNLLDRHYQDPVGFLRPGIGAFGGVRINLAAKALGL